MVRGHIAGELARGILSINLSWKHLALKLHSSRQKYFRHMKKLFLFVLIFFAQQAFSQQIDYKGLPQWRWHKEDSTEYYLYTPSDMKKGKKYPVVLAMH